MVQLKKNKAGGMDNIVSEPVKYGGQYLRQLILLTHMWKEENMSSE